MEEKIINIAKNIFNSEITRESRIGSIEKWDSLGHLTLFMAIEKKLGIECSPEEIIKANSIETITKLFESKEN